jgi:two-component system OmpR family response regulator
MSRKILVVDDDPHIREVIRFALEKAGMSVREAANGQEGLREVSLFQPDLIVLDIIMPEMDGLEMCRELRRTSELPILFLSSRDDELDRIIGLEIGGDDYVTKPFSPRELAARVNVILKRLTRPTESSQEKILSHGEVRLDPVMHCAYWKEQPVTLTATEFNLLQALLRHPGRVYTRDDLIDGGVFSDVVSDRTVDSHIRRLRGKYTEVGADTVVETVHGVGYKLGSCR